MMRTLETTTEELKQEVASNLAALFPVKWEELQSDDALWGKFALLLQEGDTLTFVEKYDSWPEYIKLEQGQIVIEIPMPPENIHPKIVNVSGETSWRISELLKKFGRNPVRLTPSGDVIYPVDSQQIEAFAPDATYNRRSLSQRRPEAEKFDGVDRPHEDSLTDIPD